ncbi:MAG: FAD-dependent oxidoreductase [Patescibacteria group bacterium]
MKKQALVIGAGIHGSTIAIELGKQGFDVVVVDSNPDILMGTSGATHNRIHLGYHYPRSVETALECKKGNQYFVKHFGDCMTYPDFYYAIEKNDSRISSQEYKNFMDVVGLDYVEEWPDESFLNRSEMESSFKVKEGYFDIVRLREVIKKRFAEYGVRTHLDFFIERGESDGAASVRLYPKAGERLELKADLIVNATYTNTNNIQKCFGLTDHLTEYEFENTEVAVVAYDGEIPALTVMDGPFITIVPYGGYKGMYLVYDVVHSVISRTYGVEYAEPKRQESNWSRMAEHGLKYYPFFRDLMYVRSLRANRPIPLEKESQEDDSRATRVVRHDFPVPFYSILEGKFVSAPMVAEDIVEKILKEHNE